MSRFHVHKIFDNVQLYISYLFALMIFFMELLIKFSEGLSNSLSAQQSSIKSMITCVTSRLSLKIIGRQGTAHLSLTLWIIAEHKKYEKNWSV